MKFSIIPFVSLVALASALPTATSETEVEARSENILETRSNWIGWPSCNAVSGHFTDYSIASPTIQLYKQGKNYSWSLKGRFCEALICSTKQHIGGGTDAGIHVCNDNNYAITVSRDEIADAANVILLTCMNGGGTGLFKGQFFNNKGWNVILKGCL